jgi:hypothetical protein
MAIGDVYQIRLRSTFNVTEEMLNIFYYRQDGGSTTPTALTLAQGFNANVMNAIEDIACDLVDWGFSQVVNYANPTDAVNFGFNRTGTLVSTGNAVFIPAYTLAYRQAPGTPGQKYSYKRFGGFTGQVIDATGQFAASFGAAIEAVADALGDVLTPSGNTFTPVQVTGQKILGQPLTVARELTGSWQYNTFPTTQTTRKDSFYNWASF